MYAHIYADVTLPQLNPKLIGDVDHRSIQFHNLENKHFIIMSSRLKTKICTNQKQVIHFIHTPSGTEQLVLISASLFSEDEIGNRNIYSGSGDLFLVIGKRRNPNRDQQKWTFAR